MNKVDTWIDRLFKVGLVVVFGYLAFQSQAVRLGAQSNFSGPINSAAGYQESGTEIINTNGAFTGTVSSTASSSFGAIRVESGSLVEEWSCGTVSWNPGSVASSGGAYFSTSTELSITGAASGDPCYVGFSLATGTQEIGFSCYISGATGVTTTVILSNFGGTAVDLATGTARACYLGY